MQQVLKLRDEDIAQIEAKVTPQKIAIQPSGDHGEVIEGKALFGSNDVASIKPPNEVVAPTPPGISLSRVSAISVPFVGKPKILMGTGFVTAVALTFIFLVQQPQGEQKVDLASNASPTVSSTSQTSAQDFNNRGNDKYNKADYEGAVQDYNRAIELKPNDAEAYYNRGWAKYSLGDKQGAIADYTQAIKLKPDYADAYYYRGDAKYILKDKQGAIADYQKAADLYQKQGKSKDYQDALEKIQKLQ